MHRYYGHPDIEASENVLYILRLVIEGDKTANITPSGNNAKRPPIATNAEQVASLKTVLQAAQAEAAEWRMDHVRLWQPSLLAQTLIIQSGLDYTEVKRKEESIASGLWFGNDGATDKAPVWINNEHYAWC